MQLISVTVTDANDAPVLTSSSTSSVPENTPFSPTLTATDAEEVLRMLRDPGSHVDMVISDIVMPGTNGLDLAHQLRDMRPKMPILLLSGYPQRLTNEGNVEGFDFPFLAKPFLSATLKAQVRMLLDARVHA